MTKMRLTTVQFAFPYDDPAYRLCELRDTLQEELFEAQGLAGSFRILGTEEMDDSVEDFFTGADYQPSAIPHNATAIIREETAENNAQHEADLASLERWAHLLGFRDAVDVKEAPSSTRADMQRLAFRGLTKLDGDNFSITPAGYKAIRWIA